MIRCIVLWLAMLASPMLAAPVTVTSGEHEGFTRLVFDFGVPVDWQVGRSDDGYELRLKGLRPNYDLRQAFDLIGKSRLAAIWVDPETGSLRVGMACACHALPFEFRPGIVVMDLRDGPPQEGAAFESTLDGVNLPPLSAEPPRRPKRRPTGSDPAAPYRWTDHVLPKLHQYPVTEQSDRPAVLPGDPALVSLRRTLIEQMARGATEGVLDIAKSLPDLTDNSDHDFPLVQIRIGDAPSDVTTAARSEKPDLAADGSSCDSADSLSIADWGNASQPATETLAAAALGLTGEFDKPDLEAVERAIRTHLYLGFGAEARQLVRAFPHASPEVGTWHSLSYLLDGEADPTQHFRGKAACEGPAALWAVLASPDLVEGDPIAANAVVLAFSALPLHLRKSLGPLLSDRFIALHDLATARALNSAILRAGGEPGAAVELISADLLLSEQSNAEAEHLAKEVLGDPGPAEVDALIALVFARVAQRLPVKPETAVALQALLAEQEDSAAPALRRAAVLADAASGSFAAAFAALPTAPEAEPDLWALTVALATDPDFLTYAVLSDQQAVPRVSTESIQGIAARLLDLGLPGPASRWLQGQAAADPFLVARIALAQKDGASTLLALSGQNDATAIALQAQALELLNQEPARAALLVEYDPAAAIVAQARAQDWRALASAGDSPWAAVAQELEAPPTAPETLAPLGSMEYGKQLLTAAGTTRSAVEALLAQVPATNTGMP